MTTGDAPILLAGTSTALSATCAKNVSRIPLMDASLVQSSVRWLKSIASVAFSADTVCRALSARMYNTGREGPREESHEHNVTGHNRESVSRMVHRA
jgi:hypothetical protein